LERPDLHEGIWIDLGGNDQGDSTQLYGHPYFGFSLSRDGIHFNRRENVRRSVEQEYLDLLTFVREHSNDFGIARNTAEARALLKQGKTVIVLSLEGAWATLETPEDFHLWIEERGLAIVTPVHLTPDDLGGNSMMNTLVSLANSTMDFLRALNASNGTCINVYCKSLNGLTPKGERIIDELMYRNVWIDLAHANDLELESILRRYEHGTPTSGSVPLPALITHTQLRDYFPVERGLSELEIDYIHKHDGIAGLIPSQYMMPVAMKNAEAEAAKIKPELATNPVKARAAACISGIDIFRGTVAHAAEVLGDVSRVTLGSDINAPLNGLSPGCGEPVAAAGVSSGQALLDLHRRGYYSYSQWNALTRFVAPEKMSAPWADQALEHFLTLWERVRP
jgi:microsomal dipeptidase-like Zn-dependent dipeptidase